MATKLTELPEAAPIHKVACGLARSCDKLKPL